MRRNANEPIRSLPLVGILLIALATPAGAAIQERFSGGVVFFPFDVIGEEVTGRYFTMIRDISSKVLVDEIRSAPAIDWLERTKRIDDAPADAAERRRIAAASKAAFVVWGEFEVIRGNVLITIHWFDLWRDRSGSQQAPLGKEDLGDFDMVERNIRDLGRALVEEMTSLGDGRDAAEVLLVSCFKGGESVDQPFLDRFLTTELPQHLARKLEQAGVSPERVRVEGLSFDAYDATCEGFRAMKQVPNRPAFPSDRAHYRFKLSGSILRGKQGYDVLTRVSTDLTHGLAPLGDFQVEEGMEPRGVPELLAQDLAGQLRNFLVEQRLRREGIEWSTIPDGTFDEQTEEVLRRFQQDRGLDRSGRIDEATLEALELR